MISRGKSLSQLPGTTQANIVFRIQGKLQSYLCQNIMTSLPSHVTSMFMRCFKNHGFMVQNSNPDPNSIRLVQSSRIQNRSYRNRKPLLTITWPLASTGSSARIPVTTTQTTNCGTPFAYAGQISYNTILIGNQVPLILETEKQTQKAVLDLRRTEGI